MESGGREKQKNCVGVIRRIWNLSASDDDLFGILVPVSFLALIGLALLGKGAEMAIVAGFAAVCMAFLKIDKFSEFSGIGFSAKLRGVEKKLEAIEVKETEVDPEATEYQFGEAVEIQVSPREKKALEAIENSKFTFRTASGISQSLSIRQAAARRLLLELEDKGFVSQIVTSRRTVAWNITALGREYLVSVGKGK